LRVMFLASIPVTTSVGWLSLFAFKPGGEGFVNGGKPAQAYNLAQICNAFCITIRAVLRREGLTHAKNELRAYAQTSGSSVAQAEAWLPESAYSRATCVGARQKKPRGDAGLNSGRRTTYVGVDCSARSNRLG
jgi:hypothetical protein